MNEARHPSLKGPGGRRWSRRALALLAALAASTSACALLDPAEYEYSTLDGFSTVTVEAAEGPRPAPDIRRVTIQVADPRECLSGCSSQQSSTCDVIPQEDGSLRIEVSARFRTLVEAAGGRDFGCSAECVFPIVDCGEADWPDGEELRIVDETGMSWVAPARSPLPVYLPEESP